MAHNYLSLSHCQDAIRAIGEEINKKGLPKKLGPMVFVFTGLGNVTKGALEMFNLLPHEFISVHQLPSLTTSQDFDNRKVYGVIVTPKEYTTSHLGEFKMEHFIRHPQDYKSIFHQSIAPYASVIVNGIYWDSNYPRLLTKEQLRNMVLENRSRLISIADISCDIGGSLEFMDHITTIDEPFFVYDPVHDKKTIQYICVNQ